MKLNNHLKQVLNVEIDLNSLTIDEKLADQFDPILILTNFINHPIDDRLIKEFNQIQSKFEQLNDEILLKIKYWKRATDRHSNLIKIFDCLESDQMQITNLIKDQTNKLFNLVVEQNESNLTFVQLDVLTNSLENFKLKIEPQLMGFDRLLDECQLVLDTVQLDTDLEHIRPSQIKLTEFKQSLKQIEANKISFELLCFNLKDRLRCWDQANENGLENLQSISNQIDELFGQWISPTIPIRTKLHIDRFLTNWDVLAKRSESVFSYFQNDINAFKVELKKCKIDQLQFLAKVKCYDQTESDWSDHYPLIRLDEVFEERVGVMHKMTELIEVVFLMQFFLKKNLLIY